MDIHHIRYFLAVCDTLNFTRAAEKCNVTQPALSRAVQQLEEELGGLLFRRERSLTHLTDFGLLMRPRFELIMNEMGDAKRDAGRFLTLEAASLTVGVMCTVGPTRFTGLLAEFRRQYPGISLKLIEGVPARLAQKLEDGELDVAIMAEAQGFPDRFHAERLYRERFLIAFPVGHRFHSLKAIPVEAIDGESYLLRANCEYQDQLSRLAEDRGARVDVAYISEREDWILNMVAGGLGICFVPEFSAVIPGIAFRPVVEPEVWREIGLITVAGRRQSPAVASFVRAVKAYPWAAAGSDQPDAPALRIVAARS